MRTYSKIIIDGKKSTPEDFEALFDVSNCSFDKANIEVFTKDNEYYWYSGIWRNGVFKGDVWDQGIFKGGVFEGRLWEYGRWEGGTWKGEQWSGGQIYVPSTGEEVISTINPTETLKKYFQGFSKDISKLKQDNISLPKEIRSIKDQTLYSIADILVRI